MGNVIQLNKKNKPNITQQNDLVAAVGTTKVTSCKQTAKLMKQAPEKFTVRIERLTNVKAQEQEIKFEEDNISVKVRINVFVMFLFETHLHQDT